MDLYDSILHFIFALMSRASASLTLNLMKMALSNRAKERSRFHTMKLYTNPKNLLMILSSMASITILMGLRRWFP